MSTPFIGEIKMFAIGFAPEDWAVCDGAMLPISENQALYSLIQDQFGGSSTLFALPGLQGRVPVYPNAEYPFYRQGFFGGYETVTLDQDEMPAHRHTSYGTINDGTTFAPLNTIPAKSLDGLTGDPDPFWAPAANLVEMADGILSSVGGGQSHANVQPSAVLLFCISMSGLYPQRS